MGYFQLYVLIKFFSFNFNRERSSRLRNHVHCLPCSLNGGLCSLYDKKLMKEQGGRFNRVSVPPRDVSEELNVKKQTHLTTSTNLTTDNII